MLGVSRQRADQLSRAGDFPSPVGEISAGRIWLRDDIEAWAKSTGRYAWGGDTGKG